MASDTDAAADEEVTRCICGQIDLVTDDSDLEDTGLFVQCDDCLVWQHGYCVGLLSESQMPDTYHCERCRPELHKIVQRPRNRRKRSRYLGLDDDAAVALTGAHAATSPAFAPSSAGGASIVTTSATAETLDKPGSSHASSGATGTTAALKLKHERSPPPPSAAAAAAAAVQLAGRARLSTAEEEESASVRRRRNTMNSRDAAYDRQLEAALLLSAQQSGTLPGTAAGAAAGGSRASVGGRSGRSNKRRSSPSAASKRTRTPSVSPARESELGLGKPAKRRKKGAAASSEAALKREETQESAYTSTSRRGGGSAKQGKDTAAGTGSLRKTTSRAKEWLQETGDALRDETRSLTTAEGGASARHRNGGSMAQGSQTGSRHASREGTPAAQTATEMAAPASRKRDRRGGATHTAGGVKKQSERAAAAAAAQAMLVGSSTRSSSSGQQAHSASSMVGIGGNLIGPAGSNGGRLVQFGEMRKRVSAILEYLGRCQVEMAAEKDEWARWREIKPADADGEDASGDKEVDKKTNGKTNGTQARQDCWSYGEEVGGSVELMEALTNTLLQWESQYGA